MKATVFYSRAAIPGHLKTLHTNSLLVKRAFKSSCVQPYACIVPTFVATYSTVMPPILRKDVVEPYKEKLEKLMQEKRVDTLDELKQHYKENIVRLRQSNKLAPLSFKKPGDYHAAANIPKIPKEKAIKTLSSYVDTEKLSQHKEIRDIELIWRARHAHDPFSLCAMLDVETFERMRANARKYPMFILPLPRDLNAVEADETTTGGTEMQFVQWAFPENNTTHCLLTSLLEYKLHTEFARPHTTLIFHSELSKSRGVVLLNGTVEKGMGVSPADAQFLVLTLQKFYNSDPKGIIEPYEREKALRRRMLLDLFKSGAGFDMKDLIREAEMAD
ncbi:ATP11 protein-domain-containing protein [Lipomyces doorenjongii]